jgi:hypothetical protein
VSAERPEKTWDGKTLAINNRGKEVRQHKKFREMIKAGPMMEGMGMMHEAKPMNEGRDGNEA